jgi:hypothetical protein
MNMRVLDLQSHLRDECLNLNCSRNLGEARERKPAPLIILLSYLYAQSLRGVPSPAARDDPRRRVCDKIDTALRAAATGPLDLQRSQNPWDTGVSSRFHAAPLP